MTPDTTQMFISYVVNYANITRNHIHEHSIDEQTINLSLLQISSVALLVIERINKGDITKISDLIDACSPIGDAFFDQLVNDKYYEHYMNEQSAKQREEHELPY